MHVYVVDRAGDFIFRYAYLDLAIRFASKTDSIFIRSKEQLEGQSLNELVSLYNTITPEDEHVARFRDKPTAVQRIWTRLEAYSVPGSEVRKYSPGRTSRWAGMRIYRNVAENPRVPATHGWYAWELIEDGMTYEEYMSRCDEQQISGRGLKHLNWCVYRGKITMGE